ncbi:MAG: hypothetical protein O3C28_10485 [Proteobacteria bacterium]|nr:hypothetical protein [Pseudomonadota bacterium]
MLNHKTNLEAQKVGIRPSEIIVSIGDDPNDPLAIILPSAEELRNLESTRKGHVSIRELLKGDPFDLVRCFADEAKNLEDKYERFQSSSTYLTHLAEVKQMSGELAEAESHLRTALGVRDEPFLKHEIGSVLMAQGKDDDAWSAFHDCDLEEDIQANLRIAHLLTRKNDLAGAEKHVANALRIDNTDYRARMFDGAIQLWKQEWERAIRSLRVAAESRDTSSALFVNLAAAHWALGEDYKAVRALKRATLLDPLNENAVLFYSDVMFLKGTPRACVAPLEMILKFEQKNEALWSRAARAYYEIARSDGTNRQVYQKSLDALKNQAALREESGVWNNMGVVHSCMRQTAKAMRYFSRAWVKAQELHEDEDVPFSNLLSSLIELRKFKEVYELSRDYLESKDDDATPSRALARIFVHHIISVEAIGERRNAAREAERLLDRNLGDQEANLEFLIHLFYFRTLVEPDKSTIDKYLPRAVEMLGTVDGLPAMLRCRALNNIVFALLMFDEVERAEPFLSELGRWVHKDIYATATFGLLHLKKGNLERAKGLYEEAIRLATHRVVKGRVRQRMFIELAKAHVAHGDEKSAHRYFEKAINEKDGFDYVDKEARNLIKSLPHK